MLAAYSKMLRRRPYFTNMMTMGITFTISDLIVQKYFEKQKWVPLQTVKGAFLGGIVLAPVLHLYFHKVLPGFSRGLLPKVFPKFYKKPSIGKIALAQVGLDQSCGTWVINWGVITLMQLLNRKPLKETIKKSNSKIYKVVSNGWKVWIPAQTINFLYVPLSHQVFLANGVAFFWTIYLTSIGAGSH